MPKNAENFDRGKLSARENQILDLAADGLTDIQIGQQLKISVSTVNSYWVRIRGKLGHLNRTELVALSLRHEARGQFETLLKRSEELEATVLQQRAAGELSGLNDIFRAAIDALPEALLVIDESGHVAFANRRAENLFGYESAGLMGTAVESLIPQKYSSGSQLLFHGPEPAETARHLGVHTLVYARERSGRQFRVILLLDTVQTPSGRITSCIVRPFIEEINSMRRRAHQLAHLR